MLSDILNDNQNKFLEWLRTENSKSKDSFAKNMSELFRSNLDSETNEEYYDLTDKEFWQVMFVFSEEALPPVITYYHWTKL